MGRKHWHEVRTDKGGKTTEICITQDEYPDGYVREEQRTMDGTTILVRSWWKSEDP